MIVVTVARGVLLLDRAGFESLFGQVGAVVALRDGADLLVAPVHVAAVGGQLVKLRNAAGDRAIDVLDLVRDCAIADEPGRDVEAEWDEDRGALRLPSVFA